MKNPQSKIIDYQNRNNRNYTDGNKIIKTTNVNILLNRVRQEKKSNSKKKMILSISMISIIFFTIIIVFGI
jgi:uncharacterized protein involved in exopolysaccharide biosynthesis